MNEHLLTSSNDCLESSIIENTNETIGSYSLLFDKEKHNFSTSSEISFLKEQQSPIDHNETISYDLSTIINNNVSSEEVAQFNPWLLLFTLNDEKQTDQIKTNRQTFSNIDSNKSCDKEIQRQITPELNALNTKNIIRHQQRRSKRNSYRNRPTDDDDDDDDDQAFEKFLQEHRTPKPVKSENKSSIGQRKKNRNSLKDFICDSSTDEDDPSEFYPKVNRIIDEDLTWRKIDVDDNDDDDLNDDDDDTSSESSQSSSSFDEKENRTIMKKKPTEISVTFLESLSKYVPIEDKHRDAKQYFTQTGFKNKKKRQELAEKLFSIFDQDVFSSQLLNKVTIVWSARLTATAGHCTTRRSSKTATITLSQKVCDSPERCRDTLLHEMCHAAVSLIDNVIDGGHGPIWRKWTRKAEQCYPVLPAISVKHTYDINYKFIYRCVQCQYEVYRHSKSLDIETDCCGKCMGKFELTLNNNNNKVENGQTPKKTLTRYNLFIKENFQKMKQAQPHLSTPQLMKNLSQEYKKKIHEQNHIDLPDIEQLKI